MRTTYANVAATLALVFSLGAGGAYAAATITGADVVDGSLHVVDLGKNAVNSPKVVDDALTGADIDESRLGQVPDAATIDGVALSGITTGRSAHLPNECDPPSAVFTKCAQVDFELARPARVLVIASGQWYAHTAHVTTAVCRLGIDDIVQPQEMKLGQPNPAGFDTPLTSADHQQSFMLSAIDHSFPGGPVLSPGVHHADLFCSVTAGDFRVDDLTISEVSLGSE